jgi:HEAT repeat protein
LIGLLDDRDFEVREKAAMALGHIGDIAALVALRNAQKDQNRDVRVAAGNSIQQIKEINQMG